MTSTASPSLNAPGYDLAHHLDKALTDMARSSPKRIAVICREGDLDCAELDARVSAMAASLVSTGFGPGTVVGIHMRRSRVMLITLLAVLRAGAAYVPLDPAYPAERLAFMVAQADVGLVLVDRGGHVSLPPGMPLLGIDEDGISAAPAARPGFTGGPALAYIIFTSGSSGRPKGIATTSANFMHFADGFIAALGLAGTDVFLATTSISFDPHTVEMILPILLGATIVLLLDDEARNPDAIARAIDDAHVTIVQGTPSFWQLMVDSHRRTLSRITVLCGGEPLSQAFQDRLFDAGVKTIWNIYGPTETTVWCSAARMIRGEPPMIGGPLPGTMFRLVDEALEDVADGGTGELLIGGPGLMEGYVNAPALTEERILRAPGSEPLYRSGDLFERCPNGRLRYVGRSDSQVKLRGYRIELLEIEAALEAHGEISHAVVVVDGSRQRLVAYIRLRGGARIVGADAALHLRGRLPPFMVPDRIEVVSQFPQTPSGKVDRSELARRVSGEMQPPAKSGDEPSPLDRVRRIWSEVLGHDGFPDDADFFAIGGNSLSMAALRMRLQESFGVRITGEQLSAHSHMFEMVQLVGDAPALAPARTATLADEAPLSASQQLLVEELAPDRIADDNMELLLRLSASIDRAEQVVRELCASQDIFATASIDLVGHRQHFARDAAPPIFRHRDRYGSVEDFLLLVPRLRACTGWGRFVLYRFEIFETETDSFLFFIGSHMLFDAVSLQLITEQIDASLATSHAPAPELHYSQWAQAAANAADRSAKPWIESLDRIEPWPLLVEQTGQPPAVVAASVHVQRSSLPRRTRAARDLLLAACCLAVSQHFAVLTMPCRIASAGRGLLAGLDDLSTIGWLSHHFPLFVNCSGPLEEIAPRIGRAFDSLTRDGMDYGWARYVEREPELTRRPDLLRFPVYFNFLPESGTRLAHTVDMSERLPAMAEPRESLCGIGFVAKEKGDRVVVTAYHDQSALSATTITSILAAISAALARYRPVPTA